MHRPSTSIRKRLRRLTSRGNTIQVVAQQQLTPQQRIQNAAARIRELHRKALERRLRHEAALARNPEKRG